MLWVYVPVRSIIGRNFKFSTVISFNDVNLCVLAVVKNLLRVFPSKPFKFTFASRQGGDVFYGLGTLFTNMPVIKAIDYIIEEIVKHTKTKRIVICKVIRKKLPQHLQSNANMR